MEFLVQCCVLLIRRDILHSAAWARLAYLPPEIDLHLRQPRLLHWPWRHFQHIIRRIGQRLVCRFRSCSVVSLSLALEE